MSEPDGARAEGPNPIRTSQVVGGIVLGLIAAFVVQAVLTIGLYSTTAGQSPVLMFVAPVLPGAVGVALLLNRRTRQAGAGALMGLAIGGIVAAGVCTALNSGVLIGG